MMKRNFLMKRKKKKNQEEEKAWDGLTDPTWNPRSPSLFIVGTFDRVG